MSLHLCYRRETFGTALLGQYVLIWSPPCSLADSHEGAELVDDCGDAQSLLEGNMSPALFSKSLQAGVETSPLVCVL
jgi:hypothetical protein